MNSEFRTRIETIISTMEDAGYSLSDDFFDFDSVPSSKMDKIFRLEAGTGEVIEISGGRVEKNKAIDVWIAFRPTARGDRKEFVMAALDSQEEIEDSLLNAFLDIPGIVVNSTMSKNYKDYLIIRIGFTLTYWRDI